MTISDHYQFPPTKLKAALIKAVDFPIIHLHIEDGLVSLQAFETMAEFIKGYVNQIYEIDYPIELLGCIDLFLQEAERGFLVVKTEVLGSYLEVSAARFKNYEQMLNKTEVALSV